MVGFDAVLTMPAAERVKSGPVDGQQESACDPPVVQGLHPDQSANHLRQESFQCLGLDRTQDLLQRIQMRQRLQFATQESRQGLGHFQGVADIVVEVVAAAGVGKKHQHPKQQQDLHRENSPPGLARIADRAEPCGQQRKEMTEYNRQFPS